MTEIKGIPSISLPMSLRTGGSSIELILKLLQPLQSGLTLGTSSKAEVVEVKPNPTGQGFQVSLRLLPEGAPPMLVETQSRTPLSLGSSYNLTALPENRLLAQPQSGVAPPLESLDTEQLPIGTQLQAKVLASQPHPEGTAGRFQALISLLNTPLAGQKMLVESPHPLPINSLLTAQVQGKQALTFVPLTGQLDKLVVQQSLEAQFTRQVPLLPLFQQMQAIAQQSPNLQPMLNKLLTLLPDISKLTQPQSLAQVLRHSGLFLEAGLLTGEVADTPQQDLKAGLLRLIAQLSSSSGPQAPTTATATPSTPTAPQPLTASSNPQPLTETPSKPILLSLLPAVLRPNSFFIQAAPQDPKAGWLYLMSQLSASLPLRQTTTATPPPITNTISPNPAAALPLPVATPPSNPYQQTSLPLLARQLFSPGATTAAPLPPLVTPSTQLARADYLPQGTFEAAPEETPNKPILFQLLPVAQRPSGLFIEAAPQDPKAGLLRLISQFSADPSQRQTTTATPLPAASTTSQSPAPPPLPVATPPNNPYQQASLPLLARQLFSQLAPAMRLQALDFPMPSRVRQHQDMQHDEAEQPLEEALLKLATAAIARLQSHQLSSLAQTQTTAEGLQITTWQMELPLCNGQDIRFVQLRLQREQADSRHQNTEPSQPIWKIDLAFDIPPLGPLQVQAQLREGQISSQFWAERSETTQLIQQELEHLRCQLTAAGLNIQELHCQQGKPPQGRRTALEQRFVDETA